MRMESTALLTRLEAALGRGRACTQTRRLRAVRRCRPAVWVDPWACMAPAAYADGPIGAITRRVGDEFHQKNQGLRLIVMPQ